MVIVLAVTFKALTDLLPARALHLGHEFLGVDSPMLAYAATNAETGLFLEQVLEVVTSTAKESNLPLILMASCFLSRWR
jgi:hypothetical protein